MCSDAKPTAQAQDGRHTHEHDHGDNVVRPQIPAAHNPQGSLMFRLLNGFLHQSSKAYVHTRYSKAGNTVALEYLDTTGMIADRYNGRRTYLGQLLLAWAGAVFACRDWLLDAALGIFDFLVLLALFVLDQVLALAWALVRGLPVRSAVVYGSLVFGTRCFWAIFQSEPWSWALLTCVLYAFWATFVGVSYLEHPHDWDVASWPKHPWAIAYSMLSWYRSPVFWNLIGIPFIVLCHYAGVTDPLFP